MKLIMENWKKYLKEEISQEEQNIKTLMGEFADDDEFINQAIEFGWNVAFPEWNESITDVADAVSKYGRLFTIQSILKTTESSRFKIDLKRKMYG